MSDTHVDCVSTGATASKIGIFSVILFAGWNSLAFAEEAPSPFSKAWLAGVTRTIQLEAGIVANPDSPDNHVNYGQIFGDRSNEFLFNQALVTVARPINPAASGYDFGFNLQALYGSDGRYQHTLGLGEYWLDGRNQFTPTLANVLVHTPWLTDGGVDFRIGLNYGAAGFETLDPSMRPFYTFSYLSNFMLAFQTVGAVATVHVNPMIDLYLGVDTGNQVSFGNSDNNDALAGNVGIGFNNLAGGKLSLIALTRFGPENPTKTFGSDANHLMRYWNDVTAIYKYSDRLTFSAEADYLYDEGLKADAWGVAGYLSYKYTDQVTFNLRGELFRDDEGLVTVAFLDDTAFTDLLSGEPANIVGAPATTYAEITAGLTYTPTALNKSGVKVSIRPEIRYDRSLSDTQPFNDFKSEDMFLFSSDLIVGF